MNKFLDALFPSCYKCLLCGRELIDTDIAICDKCNTKCLKPSDHTCIKCGIDVGECDTVCDDCKANPPLIDKNYSVFVFSGSIKRLIMRYKFFSKKYISSTFSILMYDKYLSIGRSFDIITPVPLHPNRLAERGYNHSELLLTKFVDNGLNVCTDVLIRVIDTPQQVSLPRIDRLTNLTNAFKVVGNVKGKSILLVDDVYTTGSTIRECSRVLLKAGAKSVTSLTLCRSNKNIDRK